MEMFSGIWASERFPRINIRNIRIIHNGDKRIGLCYNVINQYAGKCPTRTGGNNGIAGGGGR